MSPPRSLFSLAVVFALLAAACRDPQQRYPAEHLLSLLPSDTAILLGVRPSAFVETEAMKRIEEEVRKVEGLGAALQENGLTVSEAIHHIYIAVPPDVDPRKSDAPGRTTAILDTALDDHFLSDAMAYSRHAFQKEDVEGVAVWVNRSTSDAVALAALKKGTLAFGPFDAVRDAVLRSKGKLEGLSRKSSLFAKAGEVETESAFWAIAEMTPVLAAEAQRNPMTTDLNAVHHLVLSADYTADKGLAVKARGVCNTESEAGQVKQNLDVLVGLAGMSKNIDPYLESVLGTLVLETDKNVAQASLTIPPEALAAFFSGERRPSRQKNTQPSESKP